MDKTKHVMDFIKQLKIINGNGIPCDFKLWKCQENFIKTVIENKYTVVLKARQLGLTWTCAAYSLYVILNNDYSTVLYLSYKVEMGKDFLKKVKFLEKSLPEDMRIKGKIINRVCEFGSENTFSRIIALPSGANQGAGFSSVNVIILDEWARHPHDEEVFQSIYPTISNNSNGKIIGISTPEHAGNLFHEIWTKENGFEKLAFDWKEHPMRDDIWKNQQIKSMGIKRFERQFELRFSYSGDPVFDSDFISLKTHSRTPETGSIYFMGVDTASGSLEGDFSASCILKYEKGKFYQVKTYFAREPISVFSLKISKLAVQYNVKVILIEENNTGYAVIEKLHEHLPYELITPFNTNSSTKPVIISELEEGLRNNNILLSCERTKNELLAYSYDKKGRMNANAGMHDDTVIALALAYEARKYKTYETSDVVEFL